MKSQTRLHFSYNQAWTSSVWKLLRWHPSRLQFVIALIDVLAAGSDTIHMLLGVFWEHILPCWLHLSVFFPPKMLIVRGETYYLNPLPKLVWILSVTYRNDEQFKRIAIACEAHQACWCSIAWICACRRGLVFGLEVSVLFKRLSWASFVL